MAGLAVRNGFHQLSPGYQGEATGSQMGFADWTEQPLSGSAISSYFYRDSDSGIDSQSSRVTVKIEDHWEATKNNDNSFTIKVESYLLSIVRDDIRGWPGTTPRTIRLRQDRNSGNWLWGPVNTAVQSAGAIFSGRLLLGSRTHVLWPEGTPGKEFQSSAGSIYFRSNTLGYDNAPVPNPYTDEFYFGLDYKNTLPRKLHPPVVKAIEQSPDICEYAVTAKFTVTMDDIPDDNPHTVHLQVSNDPNFANARDFYATGSKGADGLAKFEFTVCCLKPSTLHYYRAMLNQPDLYETDWGNGSFTTLDVIKPKDVVPEFSEADCKKLTTNNYVAEWPNWEIA